MYSCAWRRYRSAVDGDQASQLLEFSTDTKEANELVMMTLAAIVIMLVFVFVLVFVVVVGVDVFDSSSTAIVLHQRCHAAVRRCFTPPTWASSYRHSAA